LHEFTFGHAGQMAMVARAHLVALAARTSVFAGIEGRAFIAIDSLLRPVCGKAWLGLDLLFVLLREWVIATGWGARRVVLGVRAIRFQGVADTAVRHPSGRSNRSIGRSFLAQPADGRHSVITQFRLAFGGPGSTKPARHCLALIRLRPRLIRQRGTHRGINLNSV
jgi:hypothetical protein